jgi:hypothetical protein
MDHDRLFLRDFDFNYDDPYYGTLAAIICGAMEKIKGLQHSANPGLRAAAIFAVFYMAPQQRMTALAKLEELVKTNPSDPALFLLASAKRIAEGPIKAFEILPDSVTGDLEALKTVFMLEMGTSFQKIKNDQAVCSRIANLLAGFSEGKYTETSFGFSDLGSEFNYSNSLVVLAGKIAGYFAKSRPGSNLDDFEELQSKYGHTEEALGLATSLAYRENDFENGYANLCKLAAKFPDNQFSISATKCDAAFSKFASSQLS